MAIDLPVEKSVVQETLGVRDNKMRRRLEAENHLIGQ